MASLQVASGPLVRSSVAAPVRAKLPAYEPAPSFDPLFDPPYGRSDGWHRPEFPGTEANGRPLSAPANKKPGSGNSQR
jgi:hypothetical protein